MDKPRVALICHEYPPYHIGGVGSYCHDLSRFVSEKKLSTTVFCGRSSRKRTEQISDYLTVVRLPFPDVALRAYWFQLWNSSFLRRALREFDVVHAISPQSSAITSVLRPPSVPFVTTMHNVPRYMSKAFFSSDPREWTLGELLFSCCEMPVDEALYRLCFHYSSRIVSVARSKLLEAKSVFPGLPMDRVVVIPNGVDFRKIEAVKRSCKEEGFTKDTDVLYCGRLACLKGTSHLIRAVSILRDELPRIVVKVIGTGPLYQRLHKRTHALGLGENIQFLGYLPPNELLSQIMRSSTVVLPSSYEGNPVSVLEAMACSRPVVAFDYPFSREVIEDGCTGLLAKRDDTQDLAEKLRVLLNDRKLRGRLAYNAFEHVFKRHNWDELADRYVEMYRGLE